jgi:hypothetical protein
VKQLRQSTHQHVSTRRYVSAEAAVWAYLEMRENIAGEKAIDYTKPNVQTTPRPESPATDNIFDIEALRLVFMAAETRCRVEQYCAWAFTRIKGQSQRSVCAELDVGKTTVLRWQRHVDRLVEQELSDRGMLVRSRSDIGAEAHTDMYDDGEGDGPAVRGPVQQVRVLVVGVDDEAV